MKSSANQKKKKIKNDPYVRQRKMPRIYISDLNSLKEIVGIVLDEHKHIYRFHLQARRNHRICGDNICYARHFMAKKHTVSSV